MTPAGVKAASKVVSKESIDKIHLGFGGKFSTSPFSIVVSWNRPDIFSADGSYNSGIYESWNSNCGYSIFPLFAYCANIGSGNGIFYAQFLHNPSTSGGELNRDTISKFSSSIVIPKNFVGQTNLPEGSVLIANSDLGSSQYFSTDMTFLYVTWTNDNMILLIPGAKGSNSLGVDGRTLSDILSGLANKREYGNSPSQIFLTDIKYRPSSKPVKLSSASTKCFFKDYIIEQSDIRPNYSFIISYRRNPIDFSTMLSIPVENTITAPSGSFYILGVSDDSMLYAYINQRDVMALGTMTIDSSGSSPKIVNSATYQYLNFIYVLNYTAYTGIKVLFYDADYAYIGIWARDSNTSSASTYWTNKIWKVNLHDGTSNAEDIDQQHQLHLPDEYYSFENYLGTVGNCAYFMTNYTQFSKNGSNCLYELNKETCTVATIYLSGIMETHFPKIQTLREVVFDIPGYPDCIPIRGNKLINVKTGTVEFIANAVYFPYMGNYSYRNYNATDDVSVGPVPFQLYDIPIGALPTAGNIGERATAGLFRYGTDVLLYGTDYTGPMANLILGTKSFSRNNKTIAGSQKPTSGNYPVIEFYGGLPPYYGVSEIEGD